MQSLILSLALLLFITACGEKKAVSGAVVTIAGIDNAALPSTGNFLISAFNPKSGDMRRVVADSSSISLTLPNGPWIFSAYHWSDGVDLGGTLRCAQSEAKLEGVEANVSLVLSADNCPQKHTESQFNDAGDLQELTAVFCSTIPGAGGTNCTSGPEGITQSYKISFAEVTLSQASAPQYAEKSISSDCISVSTLGSPALSGKFLPSGTAKTPFPFTIIAYPFPGCTGIPLKTNFDQGLLTGSDTNKKVYDFDGSPDTSWVYVRHTGSSSLNAIAASFSIPAEAIFPMDLNNFVTGASGNVTFTETGSGSLSEDVYTPTDTQEAITVVATDETGNSVSFIMNTKLGVFHDYNARVPYTWSSARSSSVGVTMSTSGYQGQETPGNARFIYDNADGSFGMISEGPRTNLLSESNCLSCTPWSNAGTSASSNGSYVFSSVLSTNVADLSGSLGYVHQTMSGVPLTVHTMSVYVKKGTGISGFYFGSTTSNCIGVVMDLSNGQTVSMQDGSICNIPGQTFSVEAANNDWWRLSMTRAVGASTLSVRVYPAWNTTLTGQSNPSITGTIIVDGVQFEEGPTATTQITTLASTETRDGDKFFSSTLGASIKKDRGTILLKWKSRPEPSLGYLFQAYDSSTPANSQIRIMKTASDQLAVDFLHAGANTRSIPNAGTIGSGTNTLVLSYDTSKILLKRAGSATVYTADRSGTVLGGDFNSASLGSNLSTESNTTNQLTKKFIHWDAHFPEEVLTQILP